MYGIVPYARHSAVLGEKKPILPTASFVIVDTAQSMMLKSNQQINMSQCLRDQN